MKAIYCDKYNAYNYLKIRDIKIPQLSENDILIHIHTSTINSGDHVVAAVGTKFGGHSQVGCLSQDQIITKFEGLCFDDAVAVIFCVFAGLHYLRKMNINKQSKLLIYGASGAVGTVSLQLAKHFGFHVSTACSSRNLKYMKELDADATYDYTKPN